MNELHRLADKLDQEVEILHQMMSRLDSAESVQLALSEAKRVRRTSTLLVQELAQQRDNLQPGGTR